MTVTPEFEAEIRQVMDDYWNEYLRGDLDAWSRFLPDHYRNIGSTEVEVWNSKAEMMAYSREVVPQMMGLVEFRNKQVQVIPYPPYFMVHELLDLYIHKGADWNFYAKFRLSSLIEQTDAGWQVLHQHGSVPDAKAQEGESIGFEQISRENQELRDAVKRRTVELEAKNRELEIEAALERVRTSAMSMNEPADMLVICKTMATQLQSLGVTDIRNVQTAIFYEAKGTYLNYEYYTRYDETIVTEADYTTEKTLKAFARKMLNGKDEVYVTTLSGNELADYVAYQKTTNVFVDTFLAQTTSLHYYWYSLGAVAMGMSSYAPLSDDALTLFRRFRNVFELAYRRYLDIEKARAQAREAQIEAALEKVRSKAMGMYKSSDLSDAATIVFDEIKKLGIKTSRAGIGIISDEDHFLQFYSNRPSKEGSSLSLIGGISMVGHEEFETQYSHWKKKQNYFTSLTGNKLKSYYDFLSTGININRDWISLNTVHYGHWLMFSEGFLFAWNETKYADEEIAVLDRFKSVIEITFRRYFDLRKAEEQAREAQIEAALERVRSRTLAMHQTSELQEVIHTVHKELLHLNLSINGGSFVVINDEVESELYCWGSGGTANTSEKVYIPHFNMPFCTNLIEGIQKRTEFFTEEFSQQQKQSYFTKLFQHKPWSDLSSAEKEETLSAIGGYTRSVAVLEHTAIFIVNHLGRRFTDTENDILKRFARVFEQAYTRFLDLKKAENQTREAQIEVALERVRSRTLAMQKSDELAGTAAVLFQQLISLSIEPNRLYIILLKENTSTMEAWVTDEEDSSVSMEFTGDHKKNRTFYKMYEGWRQKRKNLVIDMQGDELQQYVHYLYDELHVPFKGGLEQKRRVQHIAYFNHGLIGMASPDEQPAETLQLLERFAYVFNLTFIRFNDLLIAEAQAEQARLDLVQIQNEKKRAETALAELRITQAQLIQKEKLASLGELTAGIAHEIQNPLNFVNNFSEVSAELVDELKDELAKGETEEASFIADDLRQNLQRISQNGQRASNIVRGMLEHSRASSGERTHTNLNALAQEYLNLAYQGQKAKNKEFVCELVTDFDADLGRVNVVPSDIGRVLLNLYNNAFYAVGQKAKTAPADYQPIVTVSTTQQEGAVQIRVRDNGTGIPDAVKAKIFQPFFTTKPTGEGTGLGLSLSHDIIIIKGHGGMLTVASNGGDGATFTLTLPNPI